MQTEVDGWVEKGLLPGVTVAVVTPQGVWSTAAGLDGEGTPLQVSSGMALASITKTFTAAEVMLLAERGEVDLDAAASTYLDVPQVANGVTLRELMAHRSAIAQVDDATATKIFSHPNARWSPQKTLAHVPRATTPPGDAYDYNNVNYILLGLVVDKLTKGNVAAAFTRDLWQPLGLTRLAYEDQQSLPPPLARPGADEDLPDGLQDQPYLPTRSIVSAYAAAGGVAGDAQSVARWGYALYGSQLLKPESVAQMADFDDGDGYGLATVDFTSGGFFQSSIDGVGHDGAIPGYRTVLAVLPAHQTSIAILTPSTVETVPYVKWLVKAGLLAGGPPADTP